MSKDTDRPRVAILNSRQSKTPLGTDAWVRRTIAATRWAVEELGAEIVSSTTPLTWDLVTWAAGQAGATVHLFQPTRSDDATGILEDFRFPQANLTIHNVEGSAVRPGKAWWAERDRAIVDFADVLVPVSLRPGGSLEQLIAERAGHKEIVAQFRTPYAPAAHHERELIDPGRLNPKLAAWPDGYLIHWTRSCHGPWPGESRADFLNDLVDSQTRYCRSAIDTLNRILREGRLRGSAWHIGAGTPVVAFTELSPRESIPLMRWRARWARWSFEPFGIAIAMTAAGQLRIRPVRYVDAEEWESIPSELKPFCHSAGKTHPIWPEEREWRLAGDLSLDDLADLGGIIIVRETSDLNELHNSLNWPVVPMMIS